MSWDGFTLDLKKITEISDRLEALELRPVDRTTRIKYVDQIPLGLKKLVLPDFLFGITHNWAFWKNFIATRESLIVQLDQLISIEMAENLADVLTKPNFIWKGIECRNGKDLEKASELCEKFGFPVGKLY